MKMISKSKELQDLQRQVGKESGTDIAFKKLIANTSATTTDTTTTDTTAPAEQPKKKKWVMPVLIGSGVLVVGILVFVLLKKK